MATEIQYSQPSGAVSHVAGFQSAAVSCDIRNKGNDRLDLCILHSPAPCNAAGVFTKNDIVAAPVVQCREVLSSGKPVHGVVCNSGNANACTGGQGDEDARTMAREAHTQTSSPEGSFLVCSTGRIGEFLPMGKITPKIAECAGRLSPTPENAEASARAILTSDTKPKEVLAQWQEDGKTVSIGAIAKGAGMIEPNMATMLAFVFTDAEIEAGLLKELLTNATNQSFNRITVDGDMSTNDTVLLLANGASGVKIGKDTAKALQTFQDALNRICYDLAHKIVSDGERITKVVRIEVSGALSSDAAEKVCRAIGNSLLVKSSWYGNDPNWGRLVDAAGYARAGIQMGKIDLHYDEVPALLQGVPQSGNKPEWKTVVSKKDFTIHINLNLGEGTGWILSTDLSEGYVNFNKSE